MEIQHSDKKYQVLRELGKGHSGTVYLARDAQEDQVAIKALQNEPGEATLLRLRREFLILRSLNHPNIAQPIDFGYDPTLHRYFFVAEYVEGSTLEIALQLATQEQALGYFAQTLKALDYMHRQGIYHCDLKPKNIMVTPEGIVKVIDFDVASRGFDAIGGTPSYSPPEILTNPSTQPSPKTDLYSLGATFYHCLTLKKPFPGKDIQEILLAQVSSAPSLPSEMNPQLGTLWDGLLMTMLQFYPSNRFATASAALQNILPLLGEKKLSFSKEDLEYRLNQHGVPIKKEELLKIAEQQAASLDPLKKLPTTLWILEATPGVGTSYLLDEIKTIAQMKDLYCVMSDQTREAYPTRVPFLWMVDDLEKLVQQNKTERLYQLSTKLKDFLSKEKEGSCWIILGGISSIENLPEGLQFLLKKQPRLLTLQGWNERDTATFLKDIFQTNQIPPLLIKILHEEGKGNPQKISQILRKFLSSHLLFEENETFRKDLLNPTPIFLQQLKDAASLLEPKQAAPLISYSSLESELLSILSIIYKPVSGEFLEKILGTEEIYPLLRRLQAQEILAQEEGGTYQFNSSALKNFVSEKLQKEQLEQLHDRFLYFQETSGDQNYFTEDVVYFHASRGSSRLLQAQGWGYFGDQFSRKGLWQSALEFYTRAYEALPADQMEKRLEFSIHRSKCLIQKNQLQEADTLFNELLKQVKGKEQEYAPFLAKIYERLGVMENKKGNAVKAQEYFEEGLKHTPNHPPSEQYLALKNFLAGLKLQTGKYSEAISEFQQSDELAKQLPWEKRRVLTNNDLGAALVKNGQSEEAIQHWKNQLEDLEGREDKNPLARVYFQLGQTMMDKGEPEVGYSYLLQALEASKTTQNFELQLRIHNALANYFKGKDNEKALEMYENALDFALHLQDNFSTAVVLLNMGFLLAELEVYPRAKHSLTQGLKHLEEIPEATKKYPAMFQEGYSELAKLCEKLGQKEEAKQYAIKMSP